MTALHYGANRPDLQMKSWIGQCLFYTLAIVPLTMRYGLTGAAAALVASYLVGLLLQGIGTRDLIGTAVDAVYWSIGRACLIGGALAGAILLMSGAASATPFSWVLAAACLAAGGLYSSYLWLIEVPRLKVLWEHR
jgi:O-antigen/teichoic acid export membrane protein